MRRFFIRACRRLGLQGFAAWLASSCAHERATRFWFAKHYFLRVCKGCDLVLEQGRDKSHRYPDGAAGVQRGAHV